MGAGWLEDALLLLGRGGLVGRGFSSVDYSRMSLELDFHGRESRGKPQKNPTGHTLSIIESACAHGKQKVSSTLPKGFEHVNAIRLKNFGKQQNCNVLQ